MTQVARNLTDADDGFLRGMEYLILDRDPLYTAAFRDLLRDSGVKPLLLPARSPNLNAFAERFVGSVKSECLDRSCPSARNTSEPPSARSWITITRNDRTRVWATSSSRRRLHYADRAHCGAVSGSAACSSSTTARPHNPSAEFSHLSGRSQTC
jgi:transposase InsO family protein